jgi:16S rRNA (adenine1518-N6/adenine1519-N6)-dimethyltransferase
MQTLSEIRSILAERGLRPKRKLGQNFLHDQNQLRRLLEASGVKEGDLVLEVGPGTGTLTEALIDRGCSVIACELDRDMASILEDRLGDRLTLVTADCLDRSRRLAPQLEEALETRPFRLVANLPYGSASPLMSHLVTDHRCLGQFVTIQREVADRLLGQPGTRAYGPLTIFVGAFAKIRLLGTLAPGCFWPPPKVDSAMVAITPHEEPPNVDPKAFGRFVHKLFSKRRKQLGTILGRGIALPNDIALETRPDALSIDQILDLYAMAPTENAD